MFRSHWGRWIRGRQEQIWIGQHGCCLRPINRWWQLWLGHCDGNREKWWIPKCFDEVNFMTFGKEWIWWKKREFWGWHFAIWMVMPLTKTGNTQGCAGD